MVMGEVDEKEEILVSIHCCAYNHEKYIAQCLEGFIIQKTKFKFEAIVHDDASTDGTASLIKEYACKYPDIIIPIYQKENQYSKCKYNISKIMDECTRGKYIAICEGDDYWVDPYKLQKQVDLLEANPQYGLCYTKSKVYNQIKEKMEKTILGSENISFENIMLYGNGIPTLTTMFRKNLYFDYQNDVQPEKQNWLMGDLPMWLWFTANTQVGFIDEPTTVYRLLENSASHSNDIKKMRNSFLLL